LTPTRGTMTVAGSKTHAAARVAATGTVAYGRREGACARQDGCRGVALLEVVLGLALFFGVAVAILAGLSACVRSATDMRLEAQAADLAITLLSEMQLGAIDIEDAGPMAYEDETLADWSWEVVVTPVVGTLTELELTRVEIVIRNTPHDYTHRLYHLLAESAEETLMAVGGEP